MPLQTGTATGNTKVIPGFARIVPPEALHAFQGLCKGRTAACLEGLRGSGGRRPLYAEVPGPLQVAERDD